jgi:hypothetical protein
LEILLRDGAFELDGDGRRRAAALAARVGHMALELYAAVKKQKLPKKTNPGMVVAFAWYREADWPRVKQLFPDADELHDSYAEWLKSAEKSVKHLRRSGVTAEPFIVDIDDFLGWCLIRDRKRVAQDRTEYVIEKLRLKHQS